MGTAVLTTDTAGAAGVAVVVAGAAALGAAAAVGTDANSLYRASSRLSLSTSSCSEVILVFSDASTVLILHATVTSFTLVANARVDRVSGTHLLAGETQQMTASLLFPSRHGFSTCVRALSRKARCDPVLEEICLIRRPSVTSDLLM